MGLFGSSRKTFVATHVSRVIDNEHLPDSILEGMANELKENTGQLTEQVMESLAANIGIRANRMHSFGENGYTYGRPSGLVHSSFAGKTASQAVLEALTGGSVTVLYYHFGPANLLHKGWEQLVNNYGYDATTNQITGLNLPGKTVFLKNMRAIVTNATVDELANGSLDQWGTPPNAGPSPDRYAQTAEAGALQDNTWYAVDPAAGADYLLVETCWTTAGVVQTGSFTIALTGFDPSKDTHQVKYQDHNGVTKYWSYIAGTGTYPTIDALFNEAYTGSGHFFPWVYFRYNKTSEGANTASVGYQHSKKMARILNLDYDQMLEGIHDNPDIDDVEQAMMVMAVPIGSNTPIEQRYLFDFFDGLYEQQKAEPTQFSNAMTLERGFTISEKLGNALNRSAMIIQDARFKMSLNWQSMLRRRVAGTIGAVDSYSVEINADLTSKQLPSLSGDPVTVGFTNKNHRFRHQVMPGVYEEIIIYDLKMTYYIFEQYTTTADDDDDTLLIPVDFSISRDYSLPEREALYARSLQYVFNSRVTIKLAWYQTGVFRYIMMVVMIVITIVTYGSTIQGLLAAVAAGTITWSTLLMVLVQQLVKQLIVMIALRLFVQTVGTKVAFIVAIVAAIAGSSYAADVGIAGSPTATQMLHISTGLSQEIGKDIQQDFKDLLAEKSEFEKFVEEQTKLLETAQELLTPTARLAPLMIFGESPNDFYQRTVHSGNIGPIGMDAVSSFVDVALTLPKLNDTI